MTAPIECRLTFCRITSASRALAKSNYFPLFRIKTPAEAALELAISTGGFKPRNHYIPVLLCSSSRDLRKRRRKLKRHKRVNGFRYVAIKVDPVKNSRLLDALEKRGPARLHGRYAYKVDARQTCLVLDAKLEDAARHGDIADVTIADHSDRAIIRLRAGDRFPVDCSEVSSDEEDSMFDGEATTTAEHEKRHHHYGRATMAITHIFELKEKAAAIRELERLELEARRVQRRERQWKEGIAKLLDNIHSHKHRRHKSVEPKSVEPKPQVEEQIDIKMEEVELMKTLDVSSRLNDPENVEKLPLLAEVNALVTHHLMYGTYAELEETTGLLVEVEGQQKFVVGQTVQVNGGTVFVPGQTFNTESGLLYVPGITVNLDDSPAFVAGAIFANDEGAAVFLPGQTFISPEGKMVLPENGVTPAVPEGMSCMHVTDDRKHHKHKRKQRRRKPEEYLEEVVDTVTVIPDAIETLTVDATVAVLDDNQFGTLR